LAFRRFEFKSVPIIAVITGDEMVIGTKAVFLLSSKPQRNTGEKNQISKTSFCHQKYADFFRFNANIGKDRIIVPNIKKGLRRKKRFTQ